MRIWILTLLVFSSACSVWSRGPTMWKDIRPLWEDRITRDVVEGFFARRSDVKVNTFVLPVGEPPEVRLVVLANMDAKQREALVGYVDDVVRDVLRYAADTVYTDRIRIQVTSYSGGQRQAWEYWDHEWAMLPAEVSDIQLIREARKLQDTLAHQQRLE